MKSNIISAEGCQFCASKSSKDYSSEATEPEEILKEAFLGVKISYFKVRYVNTRKM